MFEPELMMRRWASFVAVLGIVGGIILFLEGVGYPFRIIRPEGVVLGLTGWVQALFAVLYLKNRASRGWAVTAAGFWLVWVVGSIPLPSSFGGWARWVGGTVGSLVWAGFPLRYLYTSIYPPVQRQGEESP